MLHFTHTHKKKKNNFATLLVCIAQSEVELQQQLVEVRRLINVLVFALVFVLESNLEGVHFCVEFTIVLLTQQTNNRAVR